MLEYSVAMLNRVELNTVKTCEHFECCYLVSIMIIQEWSTCFSE